MLFAMYIKLINSLYDDYLYNDHFNYELTSVKVLAFDFFVNNNNFLLKELLLLFFRD